MLWVCGGIALASAILALLFLPRRAEGPGEARRPDAGCSGDRAPAGQPLPSPTRSPAKAAWSRGRMEA